MSYSRYIEERSIRSTLESIERKPVWLIEWLLFMQLGNTYLQIYVCRYAVSRIPKVINYLL